jgi:acyl-CoA thioesterase-1
MSPQRLRPLWLALTALALVTAVQTPAATKPPAKGGSAAVCTAPADLTRLDNPLVRTMRRLAAGDPVTIVALGSSSTAGAGASSPDHAYPHRLAAELRRLYPGRPIRVLNRGINGEEVGDMLARLDETVLAEKPDLVLFQVGTNAVLRGFDREGVAAAIHEGVARIRATGADVILMDPQFAPEVIARAEIGDMVSLIATVADQDRVSLFHRFAVMQNWREASGIPFRTFIAADNLHMNDWGYGCVAKILAGSIADAASRPTLTAAARP